MLKEQEAGAATAEVCRRIHIMLDRQSIVMNQKKLRRLYCEEEL